MTGFPDAPRGNTPGDPGGGARGESGPQRPAEGRSTGAPPDDPAAPAPRRAVHPDLDGAAGRDLHGHLQHDHLHHDLHRDLDAGEPGGVEPDPLERLLRPPGSYLSPPPGSFERIRRRAARRRRNRATAGGVIVAATITGSVYLAGALSPHDSGVSVGPPATSSRVSHAPTPPAPTGRRTPAPTTSLPATTADGPPSPVVSSPSPSAAPTSTPGGETSPTAARIPMCTAGQLKAGLGGSDAGAGQLYQYLVLTNAGRTACHLIGFPGVSLLDANGSQIGPPATRDQRPYQSVTLAPGGSASDTIHTADGQGRCLPPSTSLRVYPPGSRDSLEISGRVTICDSLFTITPLTGGRSGNPSS